MGLVIHDNEVYQDHAMGDEVVMGVPFLSRGNPMIGIDEVEAHFRIKLYWCHDCKGVMMRPFNAERDAQGRPRCLPCASKVFPEVKRMIEDEANADE